MDLKPGVDEQELSVNMTFSSVLGVVAAVLSGSVRSDHVVDPALLDIAEIHRLDEVIASSYLQGSTD